MTNSPDETTDKPEGLNIPEYFAALKTAASLAHGFYWKPMVIWQMRENPRKFLISLQKGGATPNTKDWLKVTTVTPHARKTK